MIFVLKEGVGFLLFFTFPGNPQLLVEISQMIWDNIIL
jgi:hypothetical protein